MKKVYFLLFGLIVSTASFAQTIPGGDMENWRTGTSGGDSAEAITAPDYWFGQDSLIIAIGQSVGGMFLGTTDAVWSHQLFEVNSPVHGGSHSAMILTTYQDTLLFAGTLSNGQADVHISLSPPGISGITFFGGFPVTQRPTSVSAWVQYFPGKDTLTGLFGGNDTATMEVQAISAYAGIVSDTFILIPPASSWSQVTAYLSYTDTFATADTLRITFSSSGGATQELDSSILYVDDVTMTSIPEQSYVGVKNVVNNAEINVYPNPATEEVYFDGPQNAGLTCTLFSVSGQAATTKALSGHDAIDVSCLPPGMYFYTIDNKGGKSIQKGKVTVAR